LIHEKDFHKYSPKDKMVHPKEPGVCFVHVLDGAEIVAKTKFAVIH